MRFLVLALILLGSGSCVCGQDVCSGLAWLHLGETYRVELLRSLEMPLGSNAQSCGPGFDLDERDTFTLTNVRRGHTDRSPHNCSYDCWVPRATPEVDGVELMGETNSQGERPAAVPVEELVEIDGCVGVYGMDILRTDEVGDPEATTNMLLIRQFRPMFACHWLCTDTWSIQVVDSMGQAVSTRR